MTVDLIPTPVPVTEVHISHGVRHRCYSCPLALAVDDMLNEGFSALVSPPELAICDMTNGKSNEIVIDLPDDAIQFVEDFDDERPVSPKVFTIPLPRHLLRVGVPSSAHSPASP